MFPDPVVDGIFVRDPALLDDDTFHAYLGRRRCYHPRVVRLNAADRDQCVSIRRDRIRHDIFELAQLVAAHREPEIAVVALGVNLDLAAERRREARQVLDRRRPEGERIAFEFVEP
jgi:hypothetical protein